MRVGDADVVFQVAEVVEIGGVLGQHLMAGVAQEARVAVDLAPLEKVRRHGSEGVAIAGRAYHHLQLRSRVIAPVQPADEALGGPKQVVQGVEAAERTSVRLC